MSKVLALKYRPKRFEDLIGQDTISQTLSRALDSGRLSHAYLLSGLRGSGKTSTARIMSKSLLCDKGPTSKPCEVCDNCKSANESKHLDIIEMDAASNRGIDDIKDLIEHTKYKPSSARFKVFIIDEVHMLTTQAFNALLKTLEEPPGFVKFILATTDPLKLPATILSRTQHFRFKRISDKDVMHHLSHILNEEGIDYEPEALSVLTRSGQGSLRDTLTLMDQAIIYSKGKLTVSSVTDMLGLIDPEFMDEIFDVVLNKGNISGLLNRLEEYEAGLVIDEMTIYLKQKMIERDHRFDTLVFDRFFRILADAKHLLSLNSDSGFVLILTLSKMQEAILLKSIDEIIDEVQKIEEKQVSFGKKLYEGALKEVQKNSTSVNIAPHELAKEAMKVQVQGAQKNIDESQNIEVEVQHLNDAIPFDEEIKEQDIKKHEENLEPVKPKISQGEIHYQTLTDKIYERSHDLGECFEKNFIFDSYENNLLTITSYAKDECRDMLRKHYSLIKLFITQVYGDETDIEFQKGEKEETLHAQKKNLTDLSLEEKESANDNCTGSMLEDVEMGGGCVSDMCETQTAQKEMDIKDVLNSPMLNKAKELFDPKKITVRAKT